MFRSIFGQIPFSVGRTFWVSPSDSYTVNGQRRCSRRARQMRPGYVLSGHDSRAKNFRQVDSHDQSLNTAACK